MEQSKWSCGRCGTLNDTHKRCTGCWSKRPQPSPATKPTASPVRVLEALSRPAGGAVAEGHGAPPHGNCARPSVRLNHDDVQLNDEQRRAAFHDPSGTTVITASPGSGKTRVLCRRISWLVTHEGLDPGEILALTFSKRAACELRDRVLSQGVAGARVFTFHGFCLKLVRRHARLLGIRPDSPVVTGNAQLAIVKEAAEVVTKAGPPRASAGEQSAGAALECIASPRGCRRALEHILRIKARAAQRPWTSVDSRSEAVVRPVHALAKAYGEVLQRHGALDFTDMLVHGLHLFTSLGAEVAEGAFRHVLVDEFQDTSPLQMLLVCALCAWSEALKHGACGLTLAGDLDQSIFSFRDADPEMNMRLLGRRRPAPSAVHLSTNFRSTQRICDVATAILAGGEAAGAHGTQRRAMTATSAAGEAVLLVESRTADTEADWIARRAHDLLRAQAGTGPAPTIAVLHRLRRDGVELCGQLRRRGVPAALHGPPSAFGKGVHGVVSALRTVAHGGDDDAFASLCTLIGVSNGALASLRNRAQASGKSTGLLATARCSRSEGSALVGADASAAAPLAGPPLDKADTDALTHALHVVDALLPVARAGRLEELPALAANLVARPGARPDLDVSALSAEATAFIAAEHAMARGTASAPRDQPAPGLELLRSFLDHLADAEESRSVLASVGPGRCPGRSRGVVVVMTVHAAKGLEFDHVIVCRANEEKLPLLPRCAATAEEDVSSSRGSQALIAEERRLAFVAASRARKTLAFTYLSREFTVPLMRSRFLDPVCSLGEPTVRRLEAFDPVPADHWPQLDGRTHAKRRRGPLSPANSRALDHDHTATGKRRLASSAARQTGASPTAPRTPTARQGHGDADKGRRGGRGLKPSRTGRRSG